MVENVLVGSEDPVRKPIVAHELPDVFDGIELGAFRRQRHERDVRRHDERVGSMPSGLIEQQHGVRSGRHRGGDLGEMERHALGVAAGQDEARRFAFVWADGAVNVGGLGPLILWCKGACPAPGPTACDAVLLADPRLVLPPNLYGRTARERRPDRCQLGREVFLKAGMASASWV